MLAQHLQNPLSPPVHASSCQSVVVGRRISLNKRVVEREWRRIPENKDNLVDCSARPPVQTSTSQQWEVELSALADPLASVMHNGRASNFRHVTENRWLLGRVCKRLTFRV